jgi:orotidine-5'-phosphate decarboxylase
VPLFIDLKLHDIPNTVAGAMRGLVKLQPDIVTIHASGGSEMIAAAVSAAKSEAEKLGVKPPRIVAVTILTSLDQAALTHLGIARPVLEQVVALARLTMSAGADGMVCSPLEVAAIRSELGPKPFLVVPGIRPEGSALGDQKRVMTPKQALSAGADILVIGRPITQAADPIAAAQAILKDLSH